MDEHVLNMKTISLIRFVRIFVILGILFMIQIPLSILAQEADLFGAEDDSLLFGDEFDLGDDDTSFDFDDDSGADDSFNFDDASGEDEGFDFNEGDSSEAIGSDEDDFFGEFDEEEEAEEAVGDSVGDDDWGLEGSSDYETLITRTVAGEEEFILDDASDHPLDFRDEVKGTIMEGTGLTLSLYSPQVVADGLSTWHSLLDVSLTTDLPWHFEFYPAELTFSVDISSFKFTNSFPAGGQFRGVSIMPMATAEAFGVEVETGLGVYYPTFGALIGLGYSYQFHSLFFSTGYRWNWVYEIDPIGANWWLEPRFTFGVKLW